MIFSGESDNGKRMEILEIPTHKFFLGVQFHPEFNSRPGFPEDVFKTFVTYYKTPILLNEQIK